MKDEDWKEFIAKEMEKSLDEVMAEIEADPKMKDVKPPKGMYDNVMAMIHEHERQKIYEQLSDEDKELIRLGRSYQKKRRFDGFVVALAAVIVGLGIGSVCVGDEGDILGLMSRILGKGEEIVIDSDNIEPIVHVEESDVYERIEEEYGFTPVKLEYLPTDSFFKEGAFSSDMQGINMYYVKNGKIHIVYTIRPNYRESSLGIINEDEKKQEYTMVVQEVEVSLTEYNVEETGEKRWLLHWTHENVQYLLRITNEEQTEVEKIVKELAFNI